MLELWILIGLLAIIGMSMETKLARANRIARASHDLLEGMAATLKQIADAQKEAKAPPEQKAETSESGKQESRKDAGDPAGLSDAARGEVYRI